ncbi:hypothetical protein LCGC14_2778670, partial [marine sediment metagenome]
MARIYGDGKPLKLPSFVTQFETPDQRLRRLRETTEVLQKNQEREDEADRRRLLANLERQDARELKLTLASPVSPPKPEGHPATTPEPPDFVPGQPWNYKLLTTGMAGGPQRPEWVETEEQPTSTLGSSARYDELTTSYFDEYAGVYGKNPSPGSQGYRVVHTRALEDWTNEQGHVPNDIVTERSALLNVHIETEEDVRRAADIDTKLDIHLDTLTTDVTGFYMEEGEVDLGNGKTRQPTEQEASQQAGNVVAKEWIDLKSSVRRFLGPDASPDDVEEYAYRSMRVQFHVLDVLDEWDFPYGEGIGIPMGAQEEALRREAEEAGKIFPDGPSSGGGLLSS